jgi:hypothetical protein
MAAVEINDRYKMLKFADCRGCYAPYTTEYLSFAEV